ncbi:MAG: hypothetical protein Q8N01_07570 [Sulfuricurvum sp.]|nr:hypothetical protein [Sulfuricurvum sp.]MDP3120256.1 hypothetical protein [Sulfuricurvum sp.]
MDALKLLNIKSSVIRLRTLENGQLAVVDEYTAMRVIDTKYFRILDGFKSNVVHVNFLERQAAVSADGFYCISIVPGSDKAAVFDVNHKKLLYRVGHHKGEIESVGIDAQGRYCVTGGQDGKVFVWALQTGLLAFAMPHHSDFVTSIAFSQNGQWIATGSYDRAINVMNLSTMKQHVKLSGHSSVVVSMLFISGLRLLSAERDGALVIWDLHHGRIFKRLPKLGDEITSMCLSLDKRFAFVATRLGYVALYDLHSFELVRKRYLKIQETITSIAFIGENFSLAIGTKEGNVHFYSLFGNEAEYQELIHKKSFRVFYALLDDNPMLIYSKVYEEAENYWVRYVKTAKRYLEEGEKLKAKELLEPFIGIASKASFIQQLFHDYEHYDLFLTYTQEKRYSLAYALAKQYPSFIDSDAYKKMELSWKKHFLKAQEIIMTQNGEELARQILAPFRGITEKAPLIQAMCTERRIYEYFKKVIATRNFVKFIELTKMYTFLKEFSEYDEVMLYIDQLYIKTQKEFKNGDYVNAKKGCEILILFPEYNQETREMLEIIKIKNLFYEALLANNLISAFSYLSSYPLLYDIPEAKKLESQWNKVVDKALSCAVKGDAIELRNVFVNYLSINAKFAAIGSVFAQCYAVQLEQKMELNVPSVDLENGIRNYIFMFGIDETILEFFDLFKAKYATKTDLKMLKQGSLNTWTPAMILSDITAKKS